MIGDKELAEYYKLNSLLVYNNYLSLTEIEGMIPFERDIYVNEIIKLVDEEAKQRDK